MVMKLEQGYYKFKQRQLIKVKVIDGAKVKLNFNLSTYSNNIQTFFRT